MRVYVEPLTTHQVIAARLTGGVWYAIDRSVAANGLILGLWRVFIACRVAHHDERRRHGLPC